MRVYALNAFCVQFVFTMSHQSNCSSINRIDDIRAVFLDFFVCSGHVAEDALCVAFLHFSQFNIVWRTD